ncbi:MAG TPA: uracil-DNA glycosylase family protein [Saprospiraceae bacterium]|nr:uracil-DNA glycosylase family protein [Saprospiraceae bacterium]
MKLAGKILTYHFNLKKPPGNLPSGIEWLMPYDDEETRRCMDVFYKSYYNDERSRTFILGINPGRFGAGITGVPFTDPVRLEKLGIKNSFPKRQELSSVFIYDMIDQFGGPDIFYADFYFASLSPLGFVKGGKNYNYYDDRALADAVRPFIISNIESQLNFGANLNKVFCLGQGKNFEYLSRLNQEYKWWKEVIPLPHPRWIMQYKLKQKEEFIQMYKRVFSSQ